MTWLQDVWGIGSKLNEQLNAGGIHTVRQLRDFDVTRLRNRFGVVMERTVRELRGQSCLEMVDVSPAKQQIISSRSFGRYVTDLAELEEAVSSYMSRAAEKLRRQGSVAATAFVYIQTNQHKQDEPQYNPGMTTSFSHPTNDTRELVEAVLCCLRRIHREEFRYIKAGVMLSDITPAGISQGDLFAEHPTNSKLMHTLDQINLKLGKGALRLASDGVGQEWKMKVGNKSPAFTTQWGELPVIV